MFKRKNVKSHSDDTQPIDYKRLAKEVAKEQKRQKANEQARGCLLLIVIGVVGWFVIGSGSLDSSSSRSTSQSRDTAIPTQRASSSQSRAQSAKVASPTMLPTAAQNFIFYVCSDRVVNARNGPGYSNFEISGQIELGRSNPVLAQVEGENVSGNTAWYLIEFGGKTTYVTAHYMYACDDVGSAPAPVRESSEQATITYITSCKDRNLLHKARDATSDEVRRAEAMCQSKQIMVDMKMTFLGFIVGPLDEAKSEIYDLLCALRIEGYGMTFDIDSDFIDVYGNDKEDRAILARFEPEVTKSINCNSYSGNVRWEYVAETWWVHRALTD